MYGHYDQIIESIDELVDFLKSLNIEPATKSLLEDDYYTAHQYYEDYQTNPMTAHTSKGRKALIGLYELYKWIWSVKDSNEFNKILPHLNLLIESVAKINSDTSYINLVTGKPDDKSNKFIEAIIGLFAIKVGENVELDDPVNSSDGKNPDVIFDYNGKRIAIACKTLNSKNPSTIFDNIKSGAKQITRCECDGGYILLNAMNIVKHSKIENNVYFDWREPYTLLMDDINRIYTEIITKNKNEIQELFTKNPEVYPIVITVIHSTTRLKQQPIGIVSTSLKGTTITNFLNPENYSMELILLPNMLNNFIHNK